MIRLGSLAGYAFEGPRVLAGWTPPAAPGVFAIMYLPDKDTQPEHYAVTYVGHADDLSEIGLPFRHPRSPCWISRAGGRYGIFIAVLEAPGAQASHREQIVAELAAAYHPSCNERQYDSSWKDEWIGTYQAPTAGPLTTGRSPRPPAAGAPDAARPDSST